VRPACLQARRLAERPKGSYSGAWPRDLVSTLLPHGVAARRIAALLRLDAVLAAQEGDMNRALKSCRAVFNAGRSIGDEPTGIWLMVRMAIAQGAVNGLGRVLAQGVASEGGLADLQHLLEDETGQPLLVRAVRGERAALFLLVERIANGEFTFEDAGNLRGDPQPPGGWNWLYQWAWARPVAHLSRADTLKFMNRAVEIAKQEPHTLPESWEAWGDEIREFGDSSPLGKISVLMIPALPRLSKGYQRTHAFLHSAAVALAAERYRRAHGKWPEKLDDLIPRFQA